MKLVIGVAGSAEGNITEELNQAAFQIGKEIAGKGAILVTGGSTGLPLMAAKGAKKAGGFVVGVSPAKNRQEHIKVWKYPQEPFDFIAYTGMGRKGRNVIWVQSCDAIICIGGRMGTLNEFTIAYDEERPIGIMPLGGITKLIPEIVKVANKGQTPVFYDKNPKRLVEKLTKIPLKAKKT